MPPKRKDPTPPPKQKGKKAPPTESDMSSEPIDPFADNFPDSESALHLPAESKKSKKKKRSIPETVTHVHKAFEVTVDKDTEGENPEQENLERVYAEKVYKCFDPYKWFMSAVFRFPLSWKRTTGGGHLFYYKWNSVNSIGYCATSVIIAIITILFFINSIGSYLNFPAIQKKEKKTLNHDLRFEEAYIFRRNIVPGLILLTSLIQATVASWQLFKVRHFAASYLTFWTEMVEIVRIDVASGVRQYMKKVLICYGAFLLIFTGLCAMRFAPVAGGGPAILGMLTTRAFYPTIHTTDKFWVLRGFSGVLFIYILICSKFFMLMFLLICRLLKNAFVVWNERLERVIMTDEDKAPREQRIAHRTGFDHLFKDHVCLLDMLEGTNSIFAGGIEAYYSTQVMSLLFEIYYLYKTQSDVKEFKDGRRLDGVIIFLYLAHTLTILCITSIGAAQVGEEAMEGLEIIRKQGMMKDMEDGELYLMMSLYTSFTGHINTSIVGAGYFTLDKGFMVAIAGTVFTYFIILIQFSPSLTITPEIDSKVKHYNLKGLLEHVEGTNKYGNRWGTH